MDAVLLAARLLLAALFVIAAVGKLADLTGTRAMLARFGVPASLRHPGSIALPLLELIAAVALIPAGTAAAGAVGAALLLTTFTFALARVLARGDEVDCNCFGSAGSRPVTRMTVARNLALLGLALLVVFAGWGDPGPSAVAWIGDLDGTEAIGLAIAAVLAIACALNFAFSWQLMKQNGRLLATIEELRSADAGDAGTGLQPGDPVPGFDLAALGGGRLQLDALLQPGAGLTIVFSDPDCAACDPLLPAIGRLQADPSNPRPLVVISQGEIEGIRAKAGEHGLGPVLLQDDFAYAYSLGVGGMPAVVQIAADGTLEAKPALGTERVAETLETAEHGELGPVLQRARG